MASSFSWCSARHEVTQCIPCAPREREVANDLHWQIRSAQCSARGRSKKCGTARCAGPVKLPPTRDTAGSIIVSVISGDSCQDSASRYFFLSAPWGHHPTHMKLLPVVNSIIGFQCWNGGEVKCWHSLKFDRVVQPEMSCAYRSASVTAGMVQGRGRDHHNESNYADGHTPRQRHLGPHQPGHQQQNPDAELSSMGPMPPPRQMSDGHRFGKVRIQVHQGPLDLVEPALVIFRQSHQSHSCSRVEAPCPKHGAEGEPVNAGGDAPYAAMLINQRSRQHRRGRRPLPTRVGRQCTPNRSVMVSAASPTTRRLVRRATHAAR